MSYNLQVRFFFTTVDFFRKLKLFSGLATLHPFHVQLVYLVEAEHQILKETPVLLEVDLFFKRELKLLRASTSLKFLVVIALVPQFKSYLGIILCFLAYLYA